MKKKLFAVVDGNQISSWEKVMVISVHTTASAAEKAAKKYNYENYDGYPGAGVVKPRAWWRKGKGFSGDEWTYEIWEGDEVSCQSLLSSQCVREFNFYFTKSDEIPGFYLVER